MPLTYSRFLMARVKTKFNFISYNWFHFFDFIKFNLIPNYLPYRRLTCVSFTNGYELRFFNAIAGLLGVLFTGVLKQTSHFW